MIDASNKCSVPVSPGNYELERVLDPLMGGKDPWLVIKGTKIGFSEGWWRSHSHPSWGNQQIVIEGE